jgi:Fur family ferric uptake transcriptional regulator
MTEVQETFHHHLKRTGNKLTNQRDVILQVFEIAEGHLTAEEIYQRARRQDPTLGYTTVYRTMKLLVECGIARGEKFNDGHTRYEYDYRQKHHDHLICTECGLVVELFQRIHRSRTGTHYARFGIRNDPSQHENLWRM